MPVSPSVERTGTVIGPESVFDSTVSTRSAGAVDAVTLAGSTSIVPAITSSASVAPATLAAWAR